MAYENTSKITKNVPTNEPSAENNSLLFFPDFILSKEDSFQNTLVLDVLYCFVNLF